MIVDLAALDDGRPLIQQAGQRPDQPRLALSALAQKDDIVPGDDGALQMGQHRLAETYDAGERVLSGAKALEQVAP